MADLWICGGGGVFFLVAAVRREGIYTFTTRADVSSGTMGVSSRESCWFSW